MHFTLVLSICWKVHRKPYSTCERQHLRHIGKIMLVNDVRITGQT